MRPLYTLLLYLLMPLVVLRLLWLSRRVPGYRMRIAERFGFIDAPGADIAVWVHAVSVGEALAALPLIRRLLERHGENRVWVTTTTPTGGERLLAALGTRVRHSYLPYDLPGAVARFLDRVRPRQVVIMETEIWPNLFRAIARRGVSLTIANARLSPRSLRGYRRLAGAVREILRDVSLVAAQSETDAQAFRELGAPSAMAIGNLKFDIDPPEDQLAAGAQLRERLGAGRPVWIAASTHEHEEDAALAAHAQVRRRFADALLILVPRHPPRFDGVARLIANAGFAAQRRSALSGADIGPDFAVLLGDSLGEMWMYLAAADLAFVGGSLVPVGGHNVLEPAALGLPVLFGPHMHNFIGARDLLLGAGAAQSLERGAELADRVQRLFEDSARRKAMGEAGRAAVQANRGALERLLRLLD